MALSAASSCLVVYLPLHYLGSRLCFFGECSQPGPDEIRTYRIVVVALVVTLVATFVVAARRRARWAFAWHVTVALAGLAAAVLFSMPSVGIADAPGDAPRDDPPSPGHDYVPCHSGPPNDCPGG